MMNLNHVLLEVVLQSKGEKPMRMFRQIDLTDVEDRDEQELDELKMGIIEEMMVMYREKWRENKLFEYKFKQGSNDAWQAELTEEEKEFLQELDEQEVEVELISAEFVPPTRYYESQEKDAQGYYVTIYDVYAGAVESKGEKVCIGRRNKRIANVLLKTKKPPLMRMFVEAKQDEIAVYEYVTRKLREEFDEEGRVVIFNVEEDLTGTIEDLIEADGLESRVFCVKRANDTDGGLVECEWPKLEKTENDAGIL